MTKEVIERSAFESLIRLRGQCFEGFESAKVPEPDIVAWRGNERLGIEVTNFYRQNEKRLESEEDSIVSLARKRYEAKGGPCLHVDIDWVPNHEIARSQRDAFAREIADLVEANLPALREEVELDWSNFSDALVAALYQVTINRLVDYKRNHWQAGRSGLVPSWDPAILQSVLDRKNPKPKNYRGQYSEIWLLVVSTYHEPSSWVEMTGYARGAIYQSVFDRVFLLSSFPVDVFELCLGQ